MKTLRFGAILLFVLFAISSCKEDNPAIDTSNMSEEDLFFVDYEPPRDKWGYLNENGKLVIEDKYDNTRDFSEGLAAVNSGGKWGYIDTNGKTIIPHLYRSAFRFKNGIARVQNFELLYGH